MSHSLFNVYVYIIIIGESYKHCFLLGKIDNNNSTALRDLKVKTVHQHLKSIDVLDVVERSSNDCNIIWYFLQTY